MAKNLLLLLVFPILTACRSDLPLPPVGTAVGSTETPAFWIDSKPETKAIIQSDAPIETFTDSRRIGRPGRNKIEFETFSFEEDKATVRTRLFASRQRSDWKLRQSIDQEFDIGSVYIRDLWRLEVEFDDFNGDGFKDVTFVSAIAARSANQVRMLMIYDPKSEQLIPIRNSNDYPNLFYNRKLKCIDAWIFAGTNWTSFLRIKGDMLEEFARVEPVDFTERTFVRQVSLFDSKGRQRVIHRDIINSDYELERYMTFDPPRPYRN